MIPLVIGRSEHHPDSLSPKTSPSRVGFTKAAASWVRFVIIASLAEVVNGFSLHHSSQHLSPPVKPHFHSSLPWISAWIFGLLFVSCVAVLLPRWIFSSKAIPRTRLCSLAGLLFALGFHHWTCLESSRVCGVLSLAAAGAVVKTASHAPQPLPLALCLSSVEAMPADTGGRQEAERARRRQDTVLIADRVVRKQTRDNTKFLLDQFNSWLLENAGTNVADLVDAREVNAEEVSILLVEYGKSLYYAGKAYGRFSETINAVGSRRPLLRRQLIGAWDLAFAWVADEPHQHHPALPLSVLLAASSLALLWGWPREAAIWLMTWTGILRIGESLAATRRDLVLPQDCAPGINFALLRIQQPKTRGVGARHQAARIDPADVVMLLASTFGWLDPDVNLWNQSPSLMRRRFAAVQKALGLSLVRTKSFAPFDLGSLRPGGATFLLHKFEDAELVRRRGRWISAKVMEVYLQEVAVSTFESGLSAAARRNIQRLSEAFPAILKKVLYFQKVHIPADAWPRLW